jgi:hypothetical protein
LPFAHKSGNGWRNYGTRLYGWLGRCCHDGNGLRLMGALNRLDE